MTIAREICENVPYILKTFLRFESIIERVICDNQQADIVILVILFRKYSTYSALCVWPTLFIPLVIFPFHTNTTILIHAIIVYSLLIT